MLYLAALHLSRADCDCPPKQTNSKKRASRSCRSKSGQLSGSGTSFVLHHYHGGGNWSALRSNGSVRRTMQTPSDRNAAPLHAPRFSKHTPSAGRAIFGATSFRRVAPHCLHPFSFFSAFTLLLHTLPRVSVTAASETAAAAAAAAALFEPRPYTPRGRWTSLLFYYLFYRREAFATRAINTAVHTH